MTERENGQLAKRRNKTKQGPTVVRCKYFFFFFALCAFSWVWLFCECARVTACVSVCDVSVAKRPILLLPAQPSWEGSTSSSRVLLLKNKNLPVSHMSHMARRRLPFLPKTYRSKYERQRIRAWPLRCPCVSSFVFFLFFWLSRSPRSEDLARLKPGYKCLDCSSARNVIAEQQ